MLKIKLITGNKGGCGKTLLSIVETIYNGSERNRKTVGIDWNINNPDYIDMMDYFDKINAEKINDFFFCKTAPINDTRKILKLYTPTDRSQRVDGEIWKYLSLLYPKVKDETVLIVDTRIDISGLPDWDGKNSSYFKFLKNVKVEIYYIFGWVYSETKILELRSSFKWLEEHIPNLEFIFVWNVYDQSKPRKLFSSPAKIIYSVAGDYEKRLKHGKIPIGLSYQTLLKLIQKFNLKRIRKVKGDEIPEFYDITFRKILQKLIDQKGIEVYRNWLLIPEKLGNMTLSAESNMAQAKKDLKQIQNNIKRFYSYIAKFERMRDRFLQG